MLRLLHVADYGPRRVAARMVPSTRRVVPEVEAGIESAWANLATDRPGVTLFDGPMCRLESFAPTSAGALDLAFSRTSYKIFLGTNLARPDLAATHGRDVLASPTGVSVALQTADGYLLFGRRTAAVAYYPGRVHPFAGSVEPRGPDRDEPPDVFADVARELREEAGLTAQDVHSVALAGVAEDSALAHPELIFRAHTPLARRDVAARLSPAEHAGLVAVPATADGVDGALDDPALTPVARACLLLWGRSALRRDWFDSRSARHATAPAPPTETR